MRKCDAQGDIRKSHMGGFKMNELIIGAIILTIFCIAMLGEMLFEKHIDFFRGNKR